MKLRSLVFWSALTFAAPAIAGPPCLTDDPAPTDLKHWEIYAFATEEGRHSIVDADFGVDLNYGLLPGLQLTGTLPFSFSHDDQFWRAGSGDVELGAKYRFLNDDRSALSSAIFPRIILPTSSLADQGKVSVRRDPFRGCPCHSSSNP